MSTSRTCKAGHPVDGPGAQVVYYVSSADGRRRRHCLVCARERARHRRAEHRRLHPPKRRGRKPAQARRITDILETIGGHATIRELATLAGYKTDRAFYWQARAMRRAGYITITSHRDGAVVTLTEKGANL